MIILIKKLVEWLWLIRLLVDRSWRWYLQTGMKLCRPGHRQTTHFRTNTCSWLCSPKLITSRQMILLLQWVSNGLHRNKQEHWDRSWLLLPPIASDENNSLFCSNKNPIVDNDKGHMTQLSCAAFYTQTQLPRCIFCTAKIGTVFLSVLSCGTVAKNRWNWAPTQLCLIQNIIVELLLSESSSQD